VGDERARLAVVLIQETMLRRRDVIASS